MAKKKKTLEMALNIFAPVVKEIEGKIVSIDETSITLAYKKPRKSKTTIQRFAASQILAVAAAEFAEGADVTLMLTPSISRFNKWEKIGSVTDAPFNGFVAVDDGETVLAVAEHVAELEAEGADEEPSNRGRKKKSDEDDDDEGNAPKKRGRKPKKKDDEEDWGEYY